MTKQTGIKINTKYGHSGGIVKGEAEVGPELLAASIVEVADAAKKLLGSRLTEEAILVLLKHKTNIPMKQIKNVLYAAATLEKDYVKR